MLNFKTPDELKQRASSSQFIIEHLLIDNGIVLVAGLPKTKKSWLLAEMAISISTGTKALGNCEVNRQGTVLFIQGEDSEEIISERFNQIAQAKGLLSNKLSNIHVTTCSDFRLDNPEHLAELESKIKLLNVVAIFIDPLARMVDCPDTARAPMKKVLTALRQLQSRTGICLVIATHLSKEAKGADLSKISGSGDLRSIYNQAIIMTKPVPHVTQCDFDFKNISEKPSCFFELKVINGGLMPFSIGITSNQEGEAS